MPQKEYAATAAAVLLNKPLFQKVKSILGTCNFWDKEMTAMENAALEISLDIF